MEPIQSEVDRGRIAVPDLETPEKNGTLYQVRCGMCGKISYVDKVTYRGIKAATEAGLDCPFSCNRCQDEYDELAYEG